MQCSSCGTQLPAGTAYCPRCGAVTDFEASKSGISPDDLTAASYPYPYGTPPQELPSSSDYGSPPYGAPPQVPPSSTDYGSPSYGVPYSYGPLSPYNVPLQAPPPPLPPRRKVNPGVIIGVVALILILVGAGIFTTFALLAKNNAVGKTSPSTTTTAQTSIPTTPTSPATTATTAVTATSTTTMPYPPHNGILALDDPLHDNSKGYIWQEASDSNGSCAFTQGAYHAKTLAGGYYYPCVAHNTQFDNFAYEIQMQIVRGDCGAILFRVDSSISNFYYFRVCQDGSYALFLYSNSKGSTLTSSQTNSVINSGLNQSNLLAVVAQGSNLDLYINQQKVDSVIDGTHSTGQIGVVADGFPSNHPTEVVYSNAKVWKL